MSEDNIFTTVRMVEKKGDHPVCKNCHHEWIDNTLCKRGASPDYARQLGCCAKFNIPPFTDTEKKNV